MDTVDSQLPHAYLNPVANKAFYNGGFQLTL